MEQLLILPGIVLIFFISEFAAYLWHRYAAHTDIVPLVAKTHDIHHTDVEDKAHKDFVYICLLLFLYFWSLSYFYYYGWINKIIFMILYIPVFCVFLFNYLIHTAYHIEGHWLNGFEWFRNDKRIHLYHHENPESNYGIVTHFTDVLFDTFNYGLPLTKNG